MNIDINKLIYSECQDPVKVKIYNGITNCYEVKNVPCGKCYHCKITRINEWVTRMVIQSQTNKYMYFGTLTYNGKRQTILNDECLSLWTNFNKQESYNDTPTILRKDHLQKFFKRLRKNTGIKFQYAACGEYGETYGRPHFHYIIWSDEPISKLAIYKAWSAPLKIDPTKKACIGRIEHRDMRTDVYYTNDNKDITSVYKYICKYIQKYDFNFNQLSNFKQHEKVFYKEFNPITNSKGETAYRPNSRLDDYLKNKGIRDFYDYQKAFSPFFTCSKKPAIGYQYLAKHIDKFKEGDFRLFSLSGEYIFPLYFVRKTKESICPLKAQSETNNSTTSYSRLPKMAALINNIILAQQIADDTEQIVQLFKHNDYLYQLETTERLNDLRELKSLYAREDEQPQRAYYYQFQREYLGLCDIKNKVYYSFRGTYFAMYNNKNEYIGKETLENVKNLILYYYDELKRKILMPLAAKSAVSANKKEALIEEYGGIDKFNEAKKLCVQQFNNHINERQRKYKLSKTFE